MERNLENLCNPGGPLRREPPNRDEYDGLTRTALARLKDAGKETNSLESRFDLAYNASHALCLAALRRLGYRTNNKRYIVFQVLPHTLGLGRDVFVLLDRCHDKRNLGEYEGFLEIDETLVADLISATRQVADTLLRLPPPD